MLSPGWVILFKSEKGVWIGGRASESREWSWADNKTAFIYANWGPGEPNNHNNNEYCLEIMRTNGMWNDLPCGNTLPFVCSMSKSSEYNLDGAPNPYKCPVEKGYKPVGTSCYKVFTELSGYDAAKSTCASDSAGFKYASLGKIIIII